MGISIYGCLKALRDTEYPSGCWTKNRGTRVPQNGWVYIMENPTLFFNGWFGGTPILEIPKCIFSELFFDLDLCQILGDDIHGSKGRFVLDLKWAVIKGPPAGWVIPSYIGILIGHYQDPYEPISIMQCHKGFDHCSYGILSKAFKNYQLSTSCDSICWNFRKSSENPYHPIYFIQGFSSGSGGWRLQNHLSSDQGTLVICCIEGMKYYPVIWGLVHKPWNKNPY